MRTHVYARRSLCVLATGGFEPPQALDSCGHIGRSVCSAALDALALETQRLDAYMKVSVHAAAHACYICMRDPVIYGCDGLCLRAAVCACVSVSVHS